MRQLKVVVADDHGLMVEAVRIALAERADMEIVGVAEAGSQVLPVVQQTRPDLVLLDLRMPGMDGLTCIPLLRERCPDVKIAVLSGLDGGETVEEAMRLGASAFISKRVDPAELPDALLAAMSEEPVRGLIGRAEQPRGAAVRDAGLTERELQILRALGAGRSNREIAKTLWLAEQTVKFHLTNIYRKLNVSSRTEAVHWAYQHNLLSVGGDGDEELLRRRASGAQ
ncbi:MAG TPA: response regulator transcription factor [Gaiellaceae bacterium]|nr:response regulator transcription factor [Gaiellaceae bacterium]